MSVAPHPDAIDGYVLLSRIGTGGQSEVFLADDPKHKRQVALKLFRLDAGDAEARRAVDREITAMASFSGHPNIVQIHNSGTYHGQPYLVMPYYREGNLLLRIQSAGPQPIDEVLRCANDLASALMSLHTHSPVTVHRDIKPQNVFCNEHGYVLGDFGVAGLDLTERSTTTTSGFTIAYASPEVLRQKKATPASDMYSLGATLYTMIAGRKPFESTSPIDLPAQIVQERPARIERADLPDALQAVVQKLLEKHPSDRLTAAELRARLLVLSDRRRARATSDDTTLVRPSRAAPDIAAPNAHPVVTPDATNLSFRRRPKRWMAIAAAAAAILVAALAIGSLLDDGSSAADPDGPDLTAQPPLDDLLQLSAPTGLAFDESTRRLTWDPVDGASRYRVVGFTTEEDDEPLGEVTRAAFEVPDGAVQYVCFTVLALDGTRASERSPKHCVGVES